MLTQSGRKARAVALHADFRDVHDCVFRRRRCAPRRGAAGVGPGRGAAVRVRGAHARADEDDASAICFASQGRMLISSAVSACYVCADSAEFLDDEVPILSHLTSRFLQVQGVSTTRRLEHSRPNQYLRRTTVRGNKTHPQIILWDLSFIACSQYFPFRQLDTRAFSIYHCS